MSGKLNFGRDLFYIMRELIERGKNPDQAAIQESRWIVPDASIRLFLIQWGLSVEEIDEANTMFWNQVESDSLEDLQIVIERVVDHLSNDSEAKERLIIQMAAIGLLDFDVTEGESNFVRRFQEVLDFRPSEFSKLASRGNDLAIALNYFGNEYVKAKSKSP